MTPPLPEPLGSEIASLEAEFTGTFGLWVRDLRRRQAYGWRAEEPFRPASTIKLFILRELYRQAEAGLASLTEEIVMRREDVVPGSGVIKDLGPGLRLTLRDAATLMVTVSDNTATNLLIDRLGVAEINRATREAGYPTTRLAGRLFKTRATVPSRTTPSDLGRLMVEIAQGRAVSEAASRGMLDILRREQSDQIVGRFLPYGPEDFKRRASRWKVASKSGSLTGVRNDVALVEGGGARYVVSLMSRDCADPRFWVDNEATLCLARVARAVHDFVSLRR